MTKKEKRRAYYIANREKIIAKAHAWREANKQRCAIAAQERYAKNKEAISAYNAQRYLATRADKIERAVRWVAENRERDLANKRTWKKANRAKKREELRAWRAKNPGADIAAYHRRRARLAAVPAPGVSADAWREIKETFCGLCAYCLKSCSRPDREHVIAVSRGGADAPENVVPACRSCNSSKGNKSLVAWLLMKRAA